MSATPTQRAAYLLGLSNERVSTPVTMSGGDFTHAVYSYALCIARRHNHNAWRVLNIRSSQTTNRHIRACRQALENAGYVETGTVDVTTWEHRTYAGFGDVTRTWTVYRLAETVTVEETGDDYGTYPDGACPVCGSSAAICPCEQDEWRPAA